MHPFILASQSPRRREILADIGVTFSAVSPHADESHPAGAKPDSIVLANARAKALAVADDFIDSLIVGCDTIVYFEGEILIKPPDRTTAQAYLRRLSGKTHTVYSGLAVLDTTSGISHTGVCTTEVTFARLDDFQIDRYIDLIHPYDKAGGYAIQGAGALIVESITGCYFNVMGLPVRTLDTVLGKFGYSLFDYARR